MLYTANSVDGEWTFEVLGDILICKYIKSDIKNIINIKSDIKNVKKSIIISRLFISGIALLSLPLVLIVMIFLKEGTFQVPPNLQLGMGLAGMALLFWKGRIYSGITIVTNRFEKIRIIDNGTDQYDSFLTELNSKLP